MSLTQNDIIYFILTDRFYGVPNKDVETDQTNPRGYHGGNFPGIIEKIPYLEKLGITALWITPVYLQVPADNNGLFGYHGYWALDFNHIDPHLYIKNDQYEEGSKLYLKDLVTELHKHNIKLVLDIVVNHTGYNHPGITNSEPNPTPIRSNWFNNLNISAENNVIKGQLSGLPDLDLDSPDVSDYHIQAILSWIKETGLDAIRMDTAKHVERSFWYDYKTHVKGQYPEINLLGEVLTYSVEEISQYQQHWAFDNLFDFPMLKAMEWVFAYNNSMETFISPYNMGTGILEKDTIYTNHYKLVTFLDNHDLPARFTTVAMQATGNNYEMATVILRLALSFMFTIRGIPQIYYGTEIAMHGGGDPDNRRDLEWFKLDENYEVLPAFINEKKVFDHLRKLIQIRKKNMALTCGSYICLYVDYFLLVSLRYHEENVVITIIHNGWNKPDHSVTIDIISNSAIPERIKKLIVDRKLECQLTGKIIDVKNGCISAQMDGKSAMILI